MTPREPNTAKGRRNKFLTGDGRKNPTIENMFSLPKGNKKTKLW